MLLTFTSPFYIKYGAKKRHIWELPTYLLYVFLSCACVLHAFLSSACVSRAFYTCFTCVCQIWPIKDPYCRTFELCDTCVLHVFLSFAFVLHVFLGFTCVAHLFYMCFLASHVFQMCLACFSHVFRMCFAMCPTRGLHVFTCVFRIFPEKASRWWTSDLSTCVLEVFLSPKCVLHVFLIFACFRMCLTCMCQIRPKKGHIAELLTYPLHVFYMRFLVTNAFRAFLHLRLSSRCLPHVDCMRFTFIFQILMFNKI